jgi:hypothetical protein
MSVESLTDEMISALRASPEHARRRRERRQRFEASRAERRAQRPAMVDRDVRRRVSSRAVLAVYDDARRQGLAHALAARATARQEGVFEGYVRGIAHCRAAGYVRCRANVSHERALVLCDIGYPASEVELTELALNHDARRKRARKPINE